LAYRRTCKHINVEIADIDPKKEEAFENSTKGVVLGILFDTKNLTWALPKAKLQEILALIFILLNAPATQLKILQQLLGKWESIYSTAKSFCKSFQAAYFEFLKTIQ
jgi:hypothetical protein